MIVRGSLREVPRVPRALAIGSFDGVHLGHQAVIGRAVDVAGERKVGSGVVTFHPHPMSVLRPELAPHELSTLERRAQLIEQLGPDELVVLRFTREFSELDHERFAERVLSEALGARHVVVGGNFRYGHRAQGTVETLEEQGRRFGFSVEAAPLLELNGVPVSSSRIRDLIAAGDVEQAALLLGRPPWVEGTVIRGDGRGRGLGFATANLSPAPRSALPVRGVYAGRAHLDDRSRPAAISVGFNPTFSDARDRVRIEAHLLDFDEDIYGRRLRLDLVRRLRDEERYASIEKLVAQVHRDIAAVRALSTTR